MENESGGLHHDAIVVINGRAGSVLQHRPEAIMRRLRETASAHGVRLGWRIATQADIASTIREVQRSHPAAVLFVAGGDGTISRLLPDLVAGGAAFGVIPLGTLNLLARDLGLADDPASVARAVTERQPASIDLGEVNDIPFHSNVGIGFSARMARERELARRRFPFSKVIGFGYAALRSLVLSRPTLVDVEIDGARQQFRADAVLVTNNRFQGSPWRRPRLDEGVLEVHLLHSDGLAARFAIALALWRGTWRTSDRLTSLACREVIIRKRRWRKRTWVAIDGELRRVSLPLHLSIRPAALRIYRPTGDTASADSVYPLRTLAPL
jgi:diacylglycerol kinase family enzyme